MVLAPECFELRESAEPPRRKHITPHPRCAPLGPRVPRPVRHRLQCLGPFRSQRGALLPLTADPEGNAPLIERCRVLLWPAPALGEKVAQFGESSLPPRVVQRSHAEILAWPRVGDVPFELS